MSPWQLAQTRAALQRLTEFFRELVRGDDASRIAIFFDQIDTTLAFTFTDDFFAALRFCYNARATHPDFDRLTFALFGVATPAQLRKDKRRTPFNIGHEVTLTDFTPEEALPLARALGLPLKQAQIALERVLYWTSGQPFLTQKLCAAFAAGHEDGDVPSEVDRLVHGLFFSTGSLNTEPNLKTIADRLTLDPNAELLLSLVQDIRRGRAVRDDPMNPVHAALKLSGLVSALPDGHLAVRNRIYERLFTVDWAQGVGPVSRPPKVFISYTHDSPAHESKVLALANRLRADGIDAVLDQYEGFSATGWIAWIEEQVREAKFVLVVCTESYRQRLEGGGSTGQSLGVAYESQLIRQTFYHFQEAAERFVPVSLGEGDRQNIPSALRTFISFPAYTNEGYDDLFRLITSQPKTRKPLVAPPLPVPEVKPAFRNLVWNVPPRNPFFVGRAPELEAIRKGFARSPSLAVTALSGLGGIGKTQTALEYAHRFRADYEAVLWSSADGLDAFLSGFAALAKLLNLPEKDGHDLTEVASAVRRWLESNSGWLLVLDGVEDLNLVRQFAPARPAGHLLITTRLRVTGQPVEVVQLETMSVEEGVTFLLRRSRLIRQDQSAETAFEADRAQARDLWAELGGLPLALEQAAAFIEETPSTLAEYLALYRAGGTELRLRSGELDVPASATITVSLAFARLAESNAVAADMIRGCAFLAPDAIPEEIFTQAGREWGEPIAGLVAKPINWIEAVLEASRFALIRRDPENKSLHIHRLVQKVIMDETDASARRIWAARVVRALCEVFPNPEFQNWAQCERLLPHAKVAARLVEDFGFDFPVAAHLLTEIGYYLDNRGQYTEAEPMVRHALEIQESSLGANHPDTARSLNNLAVLYENQGRYADAEPLYRRSLAIREQTLGPEHPGTAQTLDNLALLSSNLGRYDEAESLYRRTLAIYEKAMGPDHPSIATTLNNLALLYHAQGRDAEAEPLVRQALAIREKTLGPEHPDTARSLNNLAAICYNQGHFGEAEELIRRALATNELVLGPEHPDTARSLNNLASIYDRQGRFAEAEPLYRRALAISERVLGPDHPDTAANLNRLALINSHQGRYAEAESFFRDALAINEKSLGTAHPSTLIGVRAFSAFLRQLGRDGEASELEKRVQIRE